jgi:recombination protein RecA
VKVVKNKVAPPFREAEFDILYGEGISREGDLLDLAVDRKIVDKSGTWFAYSGERLGQGRENAKQFLKEHPPVAEKIERAIRQNAGLIAGQILEGAADAGEGDDGVTGFAEDGAVAPIAGGAAARRGRRGV